MDDLWNIYGLFMAVWQPIFFLIPVQLRFPLVKGWHLFRNAPDLFRTVFPVRWRRLRNRLTRISWTSWTGLHLTSGHQRVKSAANGSDTDMIILAVPSSCSTDPWSIFPNAWAVKQCGWPRAYMLDWYFRQGGAHGWICFCNINNVYVIYIFFYYIYIYMCVCVFVLKGKTRYILYIEYTHCGHCRSCPSHASRENFSRARLRPAWSSPRL